MSIQLGASTLEALLESAQLLHASLNLDELLKHLLRTVMGRLLVARGLIAVSDEGVMRIALVRGMAKLKAGEEFDEGRARAAGVELLLPIGDEKNPVGLLGIGRSASGEIDAEERQFLHALLGIAASGIENARAHDEATRLNAALDQKVQDLRALLDLVRGFIATENPDEVARMLMLTMAGRWAVRRYAMAAWKEGHPLVLRAKGMTLDALLGVRSELRALPEVAPVAALPDGLVKEALLAEQAEVVFHVRSADVTSGGLVALGPRHGSLPYADADLEFGAGLVAQAAVAFDNLWYIRETVERKKIEQELSLAASIQENLFPATMPKLVGCDLAARNRPARHCGGDYYDALPVAAASPEHPHLLCVADVSGKGLPASLLMSNIQATLRALLGRMPSLTELAAHTNDLLHAVTPSNKYVTAILLEIDPARGLCRYVNAGHTDGLLVRADGEAVWLKATGTPLGLLPEMPYEEESFELRPGDTLALYSDGVSEAQDEAENEFSEGRVADLLRQYGDEPAQELVRRIFEEIDRFAGSAPQFDDITLLILKRVG